RRAATGGGAHKKLITFLLLGQGKSGFAKVAEVGFIYPSIVVGSFCVSLIADCASNCCRHGRACPGHPRRAAAKTGSTTARPVAKAHSREAFCFCCLLAGAPCAQSRGWPGQARP